MMLIFMCVIIIRLLLFAFLIDLFNIIIVGRTVVVGEYLLYYNY